MIWIALALAIGGMPAGGPRMPQEAIAGVWTCPVASRSVGSSWGVWVRVRLPGRIRAVHAVVKEGRGFYAVHGR